MPKENTLPSIEESCENKLQQSYSIVDMCIESRDKYKNTIAQAEGNLIECTTDLSSMQTDFNNCKGLNGVYESELLTTGCITEQGEDVVATY